MVALAFLSFFAQCRTVDVYVDAGGHNGTAVVRARGQEPTTVDAQITRDGARYRIHFAPMWGIADFTERDCQHAVSPSNGVTEFSACFYWMFGGADVEHSTLADLVKKKDAIPCRAHVQCETPDPGEPATCARMRLLEKIIPVDSDHAKLCSVK